MIYPSIDKLLKKADSKYTLVIAAAKRARMLNEGAQKLVESKSKKDVSIALEEISAVKIGFEQVKK
ncbi:MAG: DNA-directed RNA polymerase subunit omega [Bacillota bacterium]|nr:DNA-directed RNA polymerase subunit omega [Bacillota bacterium]HHU29480.1 DNA-directed RNA polymerase subunit omega [Bacillota bacterium]